VKKCWNVTCVDLNIHEMQQSKVIEMLNFRRLWNEIRKVLIDLVDCITWKCLLIMEMLKECWRMDWYWLVLIQGEGIRKEVAQGRYYLRKAANASNCNAQVNLGLSLLTERTDPADRVLAAHYLKLAAN
jgi:hypothetical protein